MNRLTFLKRLLGGVVAAPVVAKAMAKEQAPLPLPSFHSYNGIPLSVSSYPVSTGMDSVRTITHYDENGMPIGCIIIPQ